MIRCHVSKGNSNSKSRASAKFICFVCRASSLELPEIRFLIDTLRLNNVENGNRENEIVCVCVCVCCICAILLSRINMDRFSDVFFSSVFCKAYKASMREKKKANTKESTSNK